MFQFARRLFVMPSRYHTTANLSESLKRPSTITARPLTESTTPPGSPPNSLRFTPLDLPALGKRKNKAKSKPVITEDFFTKGPTPPSSSPQNSLSSAHIKREEEAFSSIGKEVAARIGGSASTEQKKPLAFLSLFEAPPKS